MTVAYLFVLAAAADILFRFDRLCGFDCRATRTQAAVLATMGGKCVYYDDTSIDCGWVVVVPIANYVSFPHILFHTSHRATKVIYM